MKESINVIINDKENDQIEVHVDLQPSQKEALKYVNLVGKS